MNDICLANAERWSIERPISDGAYVLTHPNYESITDLPTFDEACGLRKAIVSGKFITFIRQRERFLETLRKKMPTV